MQKASNYKAEYHQKYKMEKLKKKYFNEKTP